DVELSRARVHRERGWHIAGEVYVDVDLAGVAEETLGSDLVDTEVGPCGRTGGAEPQIRIRAVRIHEIGRATADPVVTGAAVYGHAHRGRAAPRRGHIGDPVPAARRKSEEADRGTRRGEGEPRDDHEDLGRECGERPPPRERDVESDEDQQERPETQDRAPRDTADEAEVAHQEQHTERDQKKRPEDARACRHGRTRCTSSRTPRAMTTSGQTICHWTPRKIPALLKKKITPTRMSR